MNRFKIALNRENDFENNWKKRETHLNDVPGFIEFHLVKCKSEETHNLYASTLLGILAKTLRIGPSQRHSEKLTKGRENIAIFILNILNLKDLKLFFSNT